MKPEVIYVAYPLCFLICFLVLRWLPVLTNVLFSSLVSFIVVNLIYMPDTYSIYTEKVAMFYYIIMLCTMTFILAYGIGSAFNEVADHTVLIGCDVNDPNRFCIV